MQKSRAGKKRALEVGWVDSLAGGRAQRAHQALQLPLHRLVAQGAALGGLGVLLSQLLGLRGAARREGVVAEQRVGGRLGRRSASTPRRVQRRSPLCT